LPRNPDGNYPLIQSCQFYIRCLKDFSGKAKGKGKLDLYHEKARLAHHNANIRKIEEDMLAKNILNVEEVKQSFLEFLSLLQTDFLSLPARWGAELPGKQSREVEVITDGDLRRAINLIADKLANFTDFSRGKSSHAGAGAKKPAGMGRGKADSAE